MMNPLNFSSLSFPFAHPIQNKVPKPPSSVLKFIVADRSSLSSLLKWTWKKLSIKMVIFLSACCVVAIAIFKAMQYAYNYFIAEEVQNAPNSTDLLDEVDEIIKNPNIDISPQQLSQIMVNKVKLPTWSLGLSVTICQFKGFEKLDTIFRKVFPYANQRRYAPERPMMSIDIQNDSHVKRFEAQLKKLSNSHRSKGSWIFHIFEEKFATSTLNLLDKHIYILQEKIKRDQALGRDYQIVVFISNIAGQIFNLQEVKNQFKRIAHYPSKRIEFSGIRSNGSPYSMLKTPHDFMWVHMQTFIREPHKEWRIFTIRHIASS